MVSPLSSLTDLAHRDVYCRPDSGWLADVIVKEALAVAAAEGLADSAAEGRCGCAVGKGTHVHVAMAYGGCCSSSSSSNTLNG